MPPAAPRLASHRRTQVAHELQTTSREPLGRLASCPEPLVNRLAWRGGRRKTSHYHQQHAALRAAAQHRARTRTFMRAPGYSDAQHAGALRCVPSFWPYAHALYNYTTATLHGQRLYAFAGEA